MASIDHPTFRAWSMALQSPTASCAAFRSWNKPADCPPSCLGGSQDRLTGQAVLAGCAMSITRPSNSSSGSPNLSSVSFKLRAPDPSSLQFFLESSLGNDDVTNSNRSCCFCLIVKKRPHTDPVFAHCLFTAVADSLLFFLSPPPPRLPQLR